MNVEIRDPRFRSVVGDDAPLELVAGGFAFTEGPIWHPYEKHLTFSDIPVGRILRWSAGAGVAVFREPSNKSNGHTYDREGRMVSCEHALHRVTRTGTDGRVSVLATHYRGKTLNSPNDIVVKSDGRIYFSDPTYGCGALFGVERTPELGFRGVYRVDADGGNLTLLADDFDQPNGLCFSRDEGRLFVNDTERGHIRVFEVADDGGVSGGGVSGGGVFASLAGPGVGGPDGMKVDRDNNLYCCGPGGLHVLTSGGDSLGVIRTPELLANFTWGDEDMRSLYLTASTSLFRVRSRTPGVRLF